MNAHESPTRRHRARRRPRLVLIVVVVTVAALAVGLHFAQEKIRSELARVLDSTSLEVTYDDLSVNLLGRRARLRNLSAVAPEGGLSLSIAGVSARIVSFGLLTDVLVLDVNVDRPVLEISEGSAAGAPLSFGKIDLPQASVVVRELVLADAEVRITHPALTGVLPAGNLKALVSGRMALSRVAARGAQPGGNAASGRLQVEFSGAELLAIPAVIDFEVGSDPSMRFVRLGELGLDFPSLETGCRAAGYMEVGAERAGGYFQVTGEVSCDRVGGFLSGDLEETSTTGGGGLALSGATFLSVELSREGGGPWRLDELTCTLGGVNADVGDLEAALTGVVDFRPGEVSTSGLTVNSSCGSITVSGSARREGGRIKADLMVTVPVLDLEALAAQSGKWRDERKRQERATSRPGEEAETGSQEEEPALAPEEESEIHLDPLRQAMQLVDLEMNVVLGNVSHRNFTMEAASGVLELNSGKLHLPKMRGRLFRGAFNFDGSSIDFNQRPAECHAVFSVDGMRAEPALERLAKFLFYQMTFTGEFSAEGEMYLDLYGRLDERTLDAFYRSMSGSARWETTVGFLEGKGAPDYVTVLVPSLDLVKFLFNDMRAEFTTVKGATVAEMFFDADGVDLEIIGQGGPDGSYTYEVFLDFVEALGLKRAEDGSNKLGRVRLLVYNGRKRSDGVPVEETVRYAPEQDLLDSMRRYVWEPARKVLSPEWLLKLFPGSKGS